MIVFIFVHIVLTELSYFKDSVASFISILAGFNPSISHDSISTRNPALEIFSAILSDLPGAYSLYFSPILITAPEIKNGSVNGHKISQLVGIRNPTESHLTALQMQQMFFICFIAFFLISCLIWIIIKRKIIFRGEKS